MTNKYDEIMKRVVEEAGWDHVEAVNNVVHDLFDHVRSGELHGLHGDYYKRNLYQGRLLLFVSDDRKVIYYGHSIRKNGSVNDIIDDNFLMDKGRFENLHEVMSCAFPDFTNTIANIIGCDEILKRKSDNIRSTMKGDNNG